MFNYKQITGALLSGMMIVSASPQCAMAITNDQIAKGTNEYDKLEYAKDNNGVTWFYSQPDGASAYLEGTNDMSSCITIPEKINGLIVSKVNSIAVKYTENGVQKQNPEASKIQKVIIPFDVELELNVFDGCTNLRNVEMPQSLAETNDYNIYTSYPTIAINGKSNPYITVGWVNSNGKRYYYYSNGQMATGFIKLGDVHYYLDEAQNNRGNLVTGWKKINGYWYYFSPSAAQNKEKGYMVTGWFGNYYMYSSGKMATGFINLNGSYYYLDASSGSKKFGWQKLNGYWYYFAKPGEAKYSGLMSKGWKQIGGVWYYFYSSGKMACNTTIEGYRLNASGAWVR